MSWGGAKSGARLVLPGFIGLTADVAYFGFRQLSDFPIRLPPSLNGFGQLSDFPIRFLRLNAFGQLCTSFRRRGRLSALAFLVGLRPGGSQPSLALNLSASADYRP